MNTRLSNGPGKRQSGYALIIMVLGLMGVGGIVASGFTQQAKVSAEEERYKHNQRVLREAKQALLQYAYDYPVTADRGPGRLPCPDRDNDANGTPNPTFFCVDGTGVVGRLPWGANGLNFYDARDATGERLWYAVSRNFAHSDDGTLVVNSASQGTITVQDRSGAIVHDGTAATGVAAVIIAPGSPIERGGVLQDRAADQNDPANYLDLFGAVDNADFTNDGTNGFVSGPIRDVVTGDLLVNDQMIVITTAEVIEMAEKATLQAYREAIDEYLVNTGGVYPWLFNYQDTDGLDGLDASELSELYPASPVFANELANALTRYGRIPSIFGPYFGTDTTNAFDGRLEGQLDYNLNSISPVTSSGHGSFTINNTPLSETFLDTSLTTDIAFVDLDGDPGQESRFTATLNSPITGSRRVYFWEDHASPAGFRLCDGGANSLSDCWRNSTGTVGNWPSHDYNLRILRVDLDFEFPVDPPGPTLPDPVIRLDIDLAVNPLPNPVITAADGNGHATIEMQYDMSDVLFTSVDNNMPDNIGVTADYAYDGHYLAGTSISYGYGTLDVTDLLDDSLLTIKIRYYPVLPRWAFDDGWHDNMRMAYAEDHRPDDTPPCSPGFDCLGLADRPGDIQDTVSLLVIGGRDQWVDDGAAGLHDDLADVFDAANADDPDVLIDDNFTLYQGNDRILVIE